MKVFSLISVFSLGIVLFPCLKPVNAQSSYGIPNTNLSQPQNNDSSFSINTGEISCSSGNGSVPSIYVGGMAGASDMDSRASIDEKQNDDYLSAAVGFNIPLGSKTNKDVNCSELLAIIEAKAFIKMVTNMQELNVLDETKTFTMITRYMTLTGDKLGLDLEAMLVLPEEYQRRRLLKIEKRMDVD